MRRLMLLRHAKSDRSDVSMPDRERPLAPRGREAAPSIAAYMARHALVPDKAVVSPATRTRDTWGLVAPAFAKAPRTAFEPRLYESTADTLLGIVRETPVDIHTLLLVGHNPGLQELAKLLVASGDLDARQQLHEKFPTAALAVIDFAIDDWRKIHPHSGRLDRLVTPRSITPETD